MQHLLDAAIELAYRVHEGQLDKGGKPYILHPISVMSRMATLDSKIVAVLHDVIEDTDISLGEIRSQFGNRIAEAVNAISKRKGEANVDYWQRVKGNELALAVKLADIGHNSSPARMAVLSFSEQEYLREKYQNALAILLA